MAVSIFAVSILASAESPYFVIQNVATDRTRVYEKCGRGPGCSNRLVLETRTLFGMPSVREAGRSRTSLRTLLGTFTITEWKKFYSDRAGKHSPWWGPGFPALPRSGASLLEWVKPKYQAAGFSREGTRGAFGWYAAMLSPNPDGQWLHGTYGWGADGDSFMDKFVDDNGLGYMNYSSGCTRVENQAVAWMQHHLPPGTKIYRIYALEELADPRLTYYENQRKPSAWDWVLTTASQSSSDKEFVRAQNLPASSILESGKFILDQYPDVVKVRAARSSSGSSRIGSGARVELGTGNNYAIRRSEFAGVYFVDEGRLENYQHPASLDARGDIEISAEDLP